MVIISVLILTINPIKAKAPQLKVETERFILIEDNALIASVAHHVGTTATFASFVYTVTPSDLLFEMKKCESAGNPLAVNPKDTDGTPSWGCLQFKPSTLKMYAERYGLADTENWEWVDTQNFLYDCDFQSQIFLRMLKDPLVRFQNEFPACYKKNIKMFNEVLGK